MTIYVTMIDWITGEPDDMRDFDNFEEFEQFYSENRQAIVKIEIYGNYIYEIKV